MAKKKETGADSTIPERLERILTASETVTLMRSQIHPADYNPREIGDSERSTLKRGLRNFGLIGGIVVNRGTGYTIVSGHQKVSLLDEMAGYPEKDYQIKAEVIDVDQKTEMEINFFMNNPSAQGRWNEPKVRILLGRIDPKRAGFSNLDLAAFGVRIETPEISVTTKDIEELQRPSDELREQRKEAVKRTKEQIREQAMERAEETDSFVTISFTSAEAKRRFCKRFGYSPSEKFINGEALVEQLDELLAE